MPPVIGCGTATVCQCDGVRFARKTRCDCGDLFHKRQHCLRVERVGDTSTQRLNLTYRKRPDNYLPLQRPRGNLRTHQAQLPHVAFAIGALQVERYSEVEVRHQVEQPGQPE